MNKRRTCNASTGIHTYDVSNTTPKRGRVRRRRRNMSMKIRQRFRDTDEIRSRRRVILAALRRHGEEDLRGVVLARGTSTS